MDAGWSGMWHGGGLDKAAKHAVSISGSRFLRNLNWVRPYDNYQAREDVPQYGLGVASARQLGLRLERHRIPIADQLSFGTTQAENAWCYETPDGPHRAMGLPSHPASGVGPRVATRRVGGFRSRRRSSRIRIRDRH